MQCRLHKVCVGHASRPWESNPSSPPARGQHGCQIPKQPRMTLRLRYVVLVWNLEKCAAKGKAPSLEVRCRLLPPSVRRPLLRAITSGQTHTPVLPNEGVTARGAKQSARSARGDVIRQGRGRDSAIISTNGGT